VEKCTGVLFAYEAKSTGLAPPVFISHRIVFIFSIILRKDKHNAMKVRIKGSIKNRECYEF